MWNRWIRNTYPDLYIVDDTLQLALELHAQLFHMTVDHLLIDLKPTTLWL